MYKSETNNPGFHLGREVEERGQLRASKKSDDDDDVY